MSKLWIIPICIFIIGWFGMFWTLNLSDINIDINMDNNTRDSIMSLNETLKRIECVGFYKFNDTNCKYIIENEEYWCTK